MTTVPAPRLRLGTPAGIRSPAWVIRLSAALVLGLYAGAHWAAIVRPSAGGDLFAMLVIALAAGLLLPSVLAVQGRARRWAALAAFALLAVGLVLLAAHVPTRTLRPDRWDALAGGIGTAIIDLPSVRVPYGGFDVWVRATLLTGGGLLLVIGVCLALLPRPRLFGAAVALGTLYAVPIVEHGPRHPTLDGAVFALLLGFLLWADRIGAREAPLAVGFAAVALLAAVIAAPRVDSGRPWIDYEKLAESLQGGKTETFRWNHRYGPLNWSRDGLELARARTRGDLYMKTVALERFDGTAWTQSRDSLADGDDTEIAPGHPSWTQRIHVSIKGLKSAQFLGSGTTEFILRSSKDIRGATPGTFEAAGKPLRRGDSYDAIVYTPRPSETEMRTAPIGNRYPTLVSRELTVNVPEPAGSHLGPLSISFAPWGSARLTLARGSHGFFQIEPESALKASAYRRTYLLAQQLQAASTDPYDYVRKVIARVQRGARYTENPPPAGTMAPLEAFLFRDHAGYCQHFAGATALLLRMGGVPARVASGFSPGSRVGQDHIIRDFDAHSWVEVYFPRIGWVTFDPTPSDSPARSQLTDTVRAQSAAPGAQRQVTPGGDRVSDPTAGGSAAAAAGQGGGATRLIAAGGAAALVLLTTGLLAVLRRRRLVRSGDPQLEELRIALARTGRPVTPRTTLHRLEQLLGGSDGALGYLESLRLDRYGPGAPPPSPAQRRALRRALGAGLGWRMRITALWALPPHPRELLDALRPRRRRPYTG
jgi:transglutaminase-like putative cysteine protease